MDSRNKISDARREFLYRDFDNVFSYRIAFSNLRLAALGLIFSFFGILISTTSSTLLLDRFGKLIAIELVVFSGIRVIAAISRAAAAFAKHIAWIEKELGQPGFSTYWTRHIAKYPFDTATYGFVIATRALNIGAFAFVSTGLTQVLIDLQAISMKYCYVVGFACPLALAIWNEIYIRTKLDPRGYIQKLEARLDQARSDTYPLIQD